MGKSLLELLNKGIEGRKSGGCRVLGHKPLFSCFHEEGGRSFDFCLIVVGAADIGVDLEEPPISGGKGGIFSHKELGFGLFQGQCVGWGR